MDKSNNFSIFYPHHQLFYHFYKKTNCICNKENTSIRNVFKMVRVVIPTSYLPFILQISSLRISSKEQSTIRMRLNCPYIVNWLGIDFPKIHALCARIFGPRCCSGLYTSSEHPTNCFIDFQCT